MHRHALLQPQLSHQHARGVCHRLIHLARHHDRCACTRGQKAKEAEACADVEDGALARAQ